MNLIGIKNALLANISAIAGINDPQYKISPFGALKMVLENNAVKDVINLAGLQSGQDTTIKVRAMQRGLESAVTDVDDCEYTITPAFVEHEITKTLYSKIGIFLSEPLLRQFEEQAASGVTVGDAAVPSILYELILTKAQALIQKIDRNIVTAINAAWGVNAVTGNANAQVVTFSASPTSDDGAVKLLLDAEANEVSGELMILGSGIIRGFEALDKLKTGTDSGGFGALGLKVYNDPKTTGIFGANQFAAIQKGSVGFVDWQKNGGTYAGEKGGSLFFTIPIPTMLANGELSSLTLDAQLKYYDCPIYDDEGVLVAPRGWVLLLSKSYGVYVAPATMYAVGDPLAGVNGIFRYVAAKDDGCISVKACGDVPIPIEVSNEDPIPVETTYPTMVNVTGITTSDNAETLAAEATWDFASKLTVAPANATAKNLILYSSSDETKATVSNVGIVTAIAAGSAVITATTVDGAFTATATITVS